MEGQLIAHYQILRKVGGGGKGVVYQAEDTKLGRSTPIAGRVLSQVLGR